MATASDNQFPKVILEEVANDGSATTTPAADHRSLFLGEDGGLHLKDSAAAVTNLTAGAWTAFTPTWTGSVTNPTIGDGQLTGRYMLVGPKAYMVIIEMVYGSTSTDGSGIYTFGNLPFTVKSTSPTFQALPGLLRDAGTTMYSLMGRLSAGATSVGIVSVTARDASGTSPNFTDAIPITLAVNDSMTLQGIIESD